MIESFKMILPQNWRVGLMSSSRTDIFASLLTVLFQRDSEALWSGSLSPNISLDAAGLVALADLKTISQRTALTGTSALLDTFVLCPGIHRQQSAPDLNGGEYPVCGAMTSGYVFRIENPATVLYLQKVGLTGQLTTLSVRSTLQSRAEQNNILSRIFTFHNASWTSSCAYLLSVVMTIVALVLLAMSHNWWGLIVILFLCTSRLCNVIIIRRRTDVSWQGASEPGVKGDLLVLLSQDRWIRMRGMVDDLKAVTSGQWLRQMTFVESSIAAFATLLVYLDAALASNVDQAGKIILLVLLIATAGTLGIANETTRKLQMHGRVIEIQGSRKQYKRRLDMAEQLVQESGREDWALRMGIIVQRASEMDNISSNQGVSV